jgi:hypothetical protein
MIKAGSTARAAVSLGEVWPAASLTSTHETRFIYGEQPIMRSQHEQRNAGGKHRPSREEKQIFEGVQILAPGGQSRNRMHCKNRAVADRPERARHEGQHYNSLANAEKHEERWSHIAETVEIVEHGSSMGRIQQFVGGPGYHHNGNAKTKQKKGRWQALGR